MAKLRGVIYGSKGEGLKTIASRLSQSCITAKLNSYNYQVTTRMYFDKDNKECLDIIIENLKTGEKAEYIDSYSLPMLSW